MPITTGHPAIILPLCRYSKWFSATGLIIGSISPDIEYLYHLAPKRTFGHSLVNAWWFDLIICFVIAILFHGIIRNSLIDNLPPFLRCRFEKYKGIKWFKQIKNNIPIFIASALIGIYSHILWDSFTHAGRVVDFISILKFKITTYKHIDIYVYNIFQQLSTLGGTLYVIYFILIMDKEDNFTLNPKWFKFWIWTVIIGLVISILYYLYIAVYFKLSIHYYVKICLVFVTGCFWGLVVISFFYSLTSEDK